MVSENFIEKISPSTSGIFSMERLMERESISFQTDPISWAPSRITRRLVARGSSIQKSWSIREISRTINFTEKVMSMALFTSFKASILAVLKLRVTLNGIKTKPSSFLLKEPLTKKGYFTEREN